MIIGRRTFDNEPRHDIVVGFVRDGKLESPKQAGTAVWREESGFYTVRINMFPNVTYFLSKNHGDNPNYTVFSRVIRKDDGVRLQNPVGFARLSDEVKTHLEITFNLLSRKLFMSLFPA